MFLFVITNAFKTYYIEAWKENAQACIECTVGVLLQQCNMNLHSVTLKFSYSLHLFCVNYDGPYCLLKLLDASQAVDYSRPI